MNKIKEWFKFDIDPSYTFSCWFYSLFSAKFWFSWLICCQSLQLLCPSNSFLYSSIFYYGWSPLHFYTLTVSKSKRLCWALISSSVCISMNFTRAWETFLLRLLNIFSLQHSKNQLSVWVTGRGKGLASFIETHINYSTESIHLNNGNQTPQTTPSCC